MNAELKKAGKYQLFYHQRKQKKYRNCGSQVNLEAPAEEQGSQREAGALSRVADESPRSSKNEADAQTAS